jgi:putative SOS response-associated peptidase YedK
VTVEANESMAKIHNNPKNPHRMPLILNPDQFRLWLTALEKDDVISKKMVSNLMQPYPSQDLSYSTVPPLLGNHGVGNNPAAQQNFVYIDLELEI